MFGDEPGSPGILHSLYLKVSQLAPQISETPMCVDFLSPRLRRWNKTKVLIRPNQLLMTRRSTILDALDDDHAVHWLTELS
jgi:hypothetical protein